jgi:hypothetical protein
MMATQDSSGAFLPFVGLARDDADGGAVSMKRLRFRPGWTFFTIGLVGLGLILLGHQCDKLFPWLPWPDALAPSWQP